MSSSDKPKKGFSIGNIRRKASFKKGSSSAATDVTSIEGAAAADEIDVLQSTAGAVNGDRMAEAQEKILALERELQESREQVAVLKTKAAQFENASAELDDDSYDAAQMFQLKKELAEIQEELAKHDEMKGELIDAKQELVELRTQNEELELQQSRRSTRTDMQRIREEKTTREEVERLHKELRQMERNAKSQTAMVEAQLKASKDSLQRAGEKAQALQRRLDLVDKERMDLKLENQRLSRKLEKSDSYAEKKRAQVEAETHQMEMANLKRKTKKLEKQLSLSTMNLSNIDELSGSFNVRSPGPVRTDSLTESQGSSGTTSPIPMTLSEARIEKLEKEVYTLEERNSSLETQNEQLKDELSAASQKATILISQVEQLQAGIGDEKQDEQLLAELPQFNHVPASSAGSTHNEDALELQQEIEKLKKELESKDTELRVRVKEMKATNDELKRQVEELEMEKLRLELGEDEEGGELTDTEEDANPKEDEKPPQEDDSDVRILRDRLMSLQDELLQVAQSNDELQTKLEQQKEEAELFVNSIEREFEEEEKKREEALAEQNKELKSKLKEQQEKCREMAKEIARLKTIIEDQEDEILLLKVQKDQLEKEFRMNMESSQEEPALVNGDVIQQQMPSPQPQLQQPPPKREKSPPPHDEKDVTPTPESVKMAQREEKVATPPPPEEKEREKEKEKEKKGTKKSGGGILCSKKTKTQPQAPTNEVDGGAPTTQKKAPSIKKRPPRDWPPKPKKK